MLSQNLRALVANASTLAEAGLHPVFRHASAYRAIQHQWGLVSANMSAALAVLPSTPPEVDAALTAGGDFFFVAAATIEPLLTHQYDAAWLADPATHRAAIVTEQARVRQWSTPAYDGNETVAELPSSLRAAAAALAAAVQSVLDLGILPSPPLASGE